MLKHTFRHRWCLALAVALPMLTGCYSKPKYGGIPIKGTVTYNGFPVERGNIQFFDWDETTKSMLLGPGHPSPAAVISKGKYAIDDIPPGKKVINFISTIGEDYQGKNEYVVEVTGQKGQVIDFPLIPNTKK